MSLALADRAALSDLVHRYAAYVDDRQFDAVAALFTDSAVLTVPDPPAALVPIHTHRGRDVITGAVAAVVQAVRTEHAIVGEVYDEGTRPGIARGRITCIAHHWTARSNQGSDEIVDVVWHLRYDDEYELTGALWQISHRALTINAIETRPVRRLLPRE
ncbi:nuclear transport factor 2 family protein [Mycobacterium riyadhense]|uniref:nuclear transport factor 2 family protein n=1 Tax=Mycobacterium riyadhense TaxID=486698 RepID=UPI00195283A0|nr:nuclear transport factor 2 family protein [Mycobacterium riyadhense]